jgi:hypothetical protein
MTSKQEPSKPETSEQQPKVPQSGELDEKELDKVSGSGWPYVIHPPASPTI